MKTTTSYRPRGSALAFASLTTFALFTSAACSRSSASNASPGASASANAATSAPPASASAPPAPAVPTTWSGDYTATAGTLFVPDGGEWSGVKFRGEDASTGLGAGTMSVTIDPKSGRAEGTSSGPLGDATVSGLLDGNNFTARIAPKDPSAGFTGTVVGAREGDAIKGTMHLSYSTANVIREGTFTLAAKK